MREAAADTGAGSATDPAAGSATDAAAADVTIAPEAPDSPAARRLIEELEAVLAPRYPAESRHGFAIERLLAEGVAFFVVRVAGEAAGCGGILLVRDGDEPYGELKRMYVRPAYRGRRLAERLIEVLAVHAAENGIETLRLETGIHQHAAIRLYERAGFRRRGPFGPYRDDPLSVLMERPTAPR